MALGGLVGSVTAAILTESYDPRYCFLFSAIMSLFISVVAVKLNVELEYEGQES